MEVEGMNGSLRMGLALGLVGALVLIGCARQQTSVAKDASTQEAVVYVYSSRHYGQLEQAFVEFTKETGIEVRFTFGKDAELRERLKAEGELTQADVLFTVDAASLWLAAQEGLLQSVDSETLRTNIPEYWRDPEGRWFIFSLRLRTIAYAVDRVSPDELSTYEALADPQWKGRLCLRPSTKSYTQALVASLIAYHGYDRAREIVAGWAQNAAEFIDSDTQILKTIAEGGCDVGIINHYYYVRLLNEDPAFGDAVRLFWANQEDRGVHANGSGAGVTAYAKRKENALRLLEWLSTQRGQRLFAQGNFEYPVRQEVELHPLLEQLGTFKIDELPVYRLGELQAEALRLMEEAGYK